MNINDITKGQIITRTELRCYYNVQTGGNHVDDRYIGDRLTYHGLANGMIILTKNDGAGNSILITIPIHDWAEGWEYYIDPMSLVEGSMNMIKENLHTRLTCALAEENYEEARRIQDEIDGKQKMIS